jgi:hypothetical protein
MTYYHPSVIAAVALFVIASLFFSRYNGGILRTIHHQFLVMFARNDELSLYLLFNSAVSQSTICSAYSSSLGPSAQICCSNNSVSFNSLEIYATSADNNGMSGCVEIEWTCGGCESQTGRVCDAAYKYVCELAQQDTTCQVCIGNGNFVFTEAVSLYVFGY